VFLAFIQPTVCIYRVVRLSQKVLNVYTFSLFLFSTDTVQKKEKKSYSNNIKLIFNARQRMLAEIPDRTFSGNKLKYYFYLLFLTEPKAEDPGHTSCVLW
jgi:hypothetical protein